MTIEAVLERIAGALETLADAATQDKPLPTAQPEAEKPKPRTTRKAKADTPTAEAAPEVSVGDVQHVAKDVFKAHGVDTLVPILEAHDCQRVSDCAPEKLPSLLAALQKALDAGSLRSRCAQHPAGCCW